MDPPAPSVSPVPNFFLVGAFKAGTTSLYQYLGQHPDVYLSPRKEPAFFVSEFRLERLNAEWRRLREADADAFARYLDNPHEGGVQPRGRVARWEDYLKLFKAASPAQAIGEGSVGYLWSRTAACAIADRIPEAHILMILRDPCDRAFSQYIATKTRLAESFSEAIRRSATEPGDRPLGPLNPFLEFGMYSEQVQRFLEAFPAGRVGVYLYDDFARKTESVVREAFRLLGVRDDVPLDLSRRYNESRVPRSRTLERVARPARAVLRHAVPTWVRGPLRRLRYRPRASVRMKPEDRRFLVDYYAQDIERLASLIGRDLSGWLGVTPSRTGGTRRPHLPSSS